MIVYCGDADFICRDTATVDKIQAEAILVRWFLV
ncbi:hypothetical protein F441_20308 [Phytophthora nicotianae CJ01A1]|uniref:Uncharacterized protein n=3 Tax=Phytophthora nicotianae TaxID=4792 RepID=V9E2R1_PHYNI|nr:hypothetical protein F443_20431 [Phytophthora nicotianae P1569]ETK73169.1 hypothetical protein L915_19870 [Phytophthora nicotianae]ETP02671.1 hypothetical protein F441_20308 [Phytophthora nicotianae CJ01A1]